jgi:glycosyltransferase involved in cell wall biosynthesis/predicted Zn-dependent protease
MSLKYLFGPVPSGVARGTFGALRHAGDCLTFNGDGSADLRIAAGDSWGDVCGRLPAEWAPDFVVVCLPFSGVPACLWSAPLVRVGLLTDGTIACHAWRRVLPAFHLVFAEPPVAEALRRAGFDNVRAAHLGGEAGWSSTPMAEGAGYPRDIDVLWVDTHPPNGYGERSEWLWPLARLASRWRVQVRLGAPPDAYRKLLARARIFLVDPEHGRAADALEAAAGGAVVFQPHGRPGLPPSFRDGEECVSYPPGELEAVVEHYLQRPEELQQIADAGRTLARAIRFEDQWAEVMREIERDWPALQERAKEQTVPASDLLLGRSLLALHGERGVAEVRSATLAASPTGTRLDDPFLLADLYKALDPGANGVHTNGQASHDSRAKRLLRLALGAVLGRQAQGTTHAVAAAEVAAEHFRQVLDDDPKCVLAGYNLAEAFHAAGQKLCAIEAARRTLEVLACQSGLDERDSEPLFFPGAPSTLADEWERAAWSNLGKPAEEARCKRDLIAWRLASLLAECTGDISFHYDAVMVRPDLPLSRGALGVALTKAGKPAEARGHLDAAVAGNPLDRPAARALFQTLSTLGDTDARQALVENQRLLQRVAPAFVPLEAWFAEPATGPGELTSLIVVCCNQLEFTRRGLESILAHTRAPYELIVVDNGSTDDTARYLEEVRARCENSKLEIRNPKQSSKSEFRNPKQSSKSEFRNPKQSSKSEFRNPKQAPISNAQIQDDAGSETPLGHSDFEFVSDFGIRISSFPERVVVLRNEVNPGHPPAVNQALKHVRGRYVVFLDNDTIMTPGWLDGLIHISLQDWPKNGMVGPVTNGAPDVQAVRPGYQDLGELDAFAETRRREFAGRVLANSRLTSFCLLVRRDVLDRIGCYWDERFHPGFFVDDDLSVRAREAGFRLVIALDVYVHHFGHRTFHSLGNDSRRQLLENFERFKAKWGEEYGVGYHLEPLRREPAPADAASQREGTPATAVAEAPASPATDDASPVNGVPDRQSFEESAGVAEFARIPSAGSDGILVNSATPSDGILANSATPGVSLCLIVKNEERNLPDCLASVQGIFDEIIVVDTGSADATRQVAERFGARVFEFPWVDSFAAARNEAVRHARHQWILWLDADDRIDEDNRGRLRQLLAGLGDERDAYALKVRSVLDAGRTAFRMLDQVRVFRNLPEIRWDYRIHEQILPAVNRAGGGVRWGDVVIDHVGYQNAGARKAKLERNLRLLELDYADRPEDGFTLFNLGWTLLDLGRVEEAAKHLRESLKHTSATSSTLRKLYHLITVSERSVNRPAEALAVCRDGLEKFPDDGELRFEEGVLLRDQQDLLGAEASWLRLLDTPRGQYFASEELGLRGFRTRQFLAEVYRAQERLVEAEVQWRAALKEQLDFEPAWMSLAELYLKQRRDAELEYLLEELDRAGIAPPKVGWLRARGQVQRRDYASARRTLEAVLTQDEGALGPRVLRSQVLIQEGRDWDAAEQSLRDILTVAPEHTETKHNLGILLRRLGRPSPNGASGRDASSQGASSEPQSPSGRSRREASPLAVG